MPVTQEDYQKVQEARKRQAKLAKEASILSSQATTFADKVMSKVQEDRAKRGVDKISQGLGTITAQLATRPAEIRERLADVNPLKTDVITARELGSLQGALATQAGIAQRREQYIADPIAAYTNQLLAKAQIKQAEADQAAQEAQNAIEMIRLKMEQEKLAMQRRGASTGVTSPLALLASLRGAQTQPAEPQPQYSPVQGYGALSPGGEWQFTQQGWQPVEKPRTGLAFDKDTLTMAMLADPKNASIYKFLIGEQTDEDGEAASMKFLLDEMESTLSKLSTGRTGFLKEKIKSIFGDPDLRRFEQQKELLAPQIAKKIMELGRLSDQDREAAMRALPREDDTPTEVKSKLRILREILDKKYGSKSNPVTTGQFEFLGWE